MSEEQRGMNERIRKLRQQSEGAVPVLSIERAVLVTEAYRQHADKVSAPMLRALTFKYLMEKKSICINDGELIVGERGPRPQETPTYPELCCHTLEDLKVISERGKIAFAVSDTVKKVQQETVIPYWHGKSMRDKIFSQMSNQWQECYEAGLFTEFMEQRAPGHTVAGGKIYGQGMLGLKKELAETIARLDFANDMQAYDKREQLKAMYLCADALISFAGRHAVMARELADRCEVDKVRQQELRQIASVCERVPAHAPRNFYEALQYYWFVHLGVITELNTWDAFSPGRLDQHLAPFYQSGISEGTLSREKAKELLECFWVKFNNQPAPPKVGITLQESGTYTDFANISLGGLKSDGADGVNEVTYLLLEVIDEMKLLQPSTNIQVSKKSPDRFIRCAGEIIRKGWGQPSVFNVEAVIQELLRQGKTLVDARNGGTSGCVEAGAFGNESYILTGYFNLTKVLEITLNQGVDPGSGKLIGLETPDPRQFYGFSQLMDAFEKQLHHFIEIKIAGNQIIEKLYAAEMPAPFLSLVIDDCLKNGKDYNAGGARYNTNYIQGVGIGTVTDSLAAIKTHIFDNHKYNWDEMLAALNENFADREQMRQFLSNKTPRYGNDDDYADSIMRDVFTCFLRQVDGRKTIRGGTYRINMLPTTCHVYFGSVIGATPDGRKAGMPLSEGISPVQGADRNGPTAVIKSAAKMDQLLTGGTLLNLKFTPRLLDGSKGLESLIYLIRSYFRMDGHHIQFNVVDAETLKQAQKDPEQYRNLIVRVAGYSDYFNNLSEQLQDEIIARTAHDLL
ncbi:MAG TPA: trans-4-hydroxy-L-proline dehydratase [Candidatus Limnocylindrales bacterium]|nr:trans-4-hydroxy-L-proline dehydratase [Candidatus Limnocylindrales bacterium]